MPIPTFDEVSTLIRIRRTNLRIDPDLAVGKELLAELCELGTWAPNHKLTEPWRFAVLTGGARSTLGELTAAGLRRAGIEDEARLQKQRTKYLRAPVVLVVACSTTSTGVRAVEDRDATAVAVQNILLAATAAGLASYWGTGAAVSSPGVADLCGFDDSDAIVAIIYLGWPKAEAPLPTRSPARITWAE